MSEAPAARWLPAPPAGWDELLGDADASFTHDPHFVRALADMLPGVEARFLAIGREGALEGGMAVVVERRGAWSWWHALPFGLPGAPLARAGDHARVDMACADAFARALDECGALGGEWVGYRPFSPPPRAALEALEGETRILTAWRVDLSSGLEAARARMDREARRGVRLAHERGVTVVGDPLALEEVYALHRAQARAWPRHRPLPLELSRRLVERPMAALLVARDGRGVVAGVLAMAARGEAFVWWSGARPEARASHAYTALLWGAAEWAAARGCRSLNLGSSAGLEPVEVFKRDLGAQPFDYPVRWLAPRRPGPIGRLIVGAQALRRRGRHRGRAA